MRNFWTEGERAQALQRGRWIAEHPDRKVAGFWLSELYSPWRRLAEIVRAFLDAKGAADTLKVFTNTSLGEVWQDDHRFDPGHGLSVGGMNAVHASVRMRRAEDLAV